MKQCIYFLALFVITVLSATPKLLADTLDVAVLPPGNINTVINGDTLAGGVRANPDRVYRLTRGSVYQVTEPMNIIGSIRIVATDGTNRPPVLAPAILSDNSSPGTFFFLRGKGSTVEMSDVYLLAVRADQAVVGGATGIFILADSVKLKLRRVVFDALNSGIRLTAHWSKIDVQDCNFRNHQNVFSWFHGFPFFSNAPNAMDTCKFINNTFFACGSYIWSIRGFDRYSVFEHNTLIYGIAMPFLMRQGSNMHIRNNLFYSMHAMGGNPDHVINSWFLNYPDTASTSIIRIRGRDSLSRWSTDVWNATITGPEDYVDPAHGVTPDMLDPALRTVDVRNNAYFWPQKLLDFYQAYNDTVQTRDSVLLPNGTKEHLKRILYEPTWVSDYTQWTVDSGAGLLSPNIKIENNVNADPGFSADIMGHVDSVIAYVRKITTGTLDRAWYYNPTGTMYPPTWPLPENLAYTNTALQNAGSDGFALGDLNWFPDQKAQWLVTGVKKDESAGLPTQFGLSQNYPNPFNPSTSFSYKLPKESNVVVEIFNVLGQRLRTLISAKQPAGEYKVTWDGHDTIGKAVASGMYIYRLQAGTFVETRRMLLLR